MCGDCGGRFTLREDCPEVSTITWMVTLAREMAGCSGMTLNVRVRPLPNISIGACGCRVGRTRPWSLGTGVAVVDIIGSALGSSAGKSGTDAPGGAPRIGARVIELFPLYRPFGRRPHHYPVVTLPWSTAMEA